MCERKSQTVLFRSQCSILLSLWQLCPVVLWQSSKLCQMSELLLQFPSEARIHGANVQLFMCLPHTWKLSKWDESQFIFLDTAQNVYLLCRKQLGNKLVIFYLRCKDTGRGIYFYCVCTAANIAGSWFMADTVRHCCRLNNGINNLL